MKVVLLAGGLGSRLSEETQIRPKPMVEIGGQPILWHIMMGYGRHGFSDFVVCLGYKGYLIKEFFANFILHRSDLTVDLATGSITHMRGDGVPDWRVTLVDTGHDTQTGGRLKRVAHLLDPDEPFCMTYGDGVSDVDVGRLLAFHHAQGLEATLTAVRPPGRFGATVIEQDQVVRFEEKPAGGWINGGFFVIEPKAIRRIAGDDTAWEMEPLTGLAADGQLAAFRHEGFWQPMDTLRDHRELEALWAGGRPPWKTW
jgi:glucose-1-phosphate cytidylyltransferase